MLNEDVVKNIDKLNNEQDNINLELSKKASKEDLDKLIQGGTNVAISKDISTNDWILDESTYTAIVEHNLVTRKILVSLIDKTTNNNIFCSYQILDDNRIKVFNESNNELECIVVNGNSAINMVSATIDDNRSTETTTYSSIKIDALLKSLENKIDDIENLKEVDNIKCSTDTGEYTIENSKKGYLTNFNIQGKTLVNLANPNNVYITDGVRYNNPFRYIESGKTYTFMNLCDKQIKYTYGGIGDITIPPYSKVLYTIPNTNITVSEIMCYGHTSDGWEETDADKQKISKAMLVLEGHYTIEDIEYVEYFDGLQSVGQEYNMELFSCKEDINIIPNNITWKDGYFLNRNDNLEYESKHYSYTLDYIPVKADTDYTLIYANWNILLYDKDKNIINFGYPNPSMSINGLGDKVSEGLFFIKTTSNSCYMRISVPNRCKDKITISEGTKFDKKVIPYTLRSLPNGVKDEIVYKNNKYYLIKRCEEIILDGDNFNPRTLEEQNNNIVLYVRTDPVPDAKPLEGVLGRINTICCDRFKSVDTTWGNEITTEGIIIDQNRTISFRILRSKLETQDIEGAKKWVKYNRIKVVYELETPREIELASLNLEQYDNQTRFICNTSAITPDISFESTQNLGSHIEVIRENLKNSNIRTDFPFSINFLNGWQPYLGSASSVSNYCTNNNFVTINAVINGGITTAGTIIGKIPSEYAPRKATIVIFQTTDGKYYNGIIRTNGKIEIYYNDITYSSWLYLYVNYLI
ncbi:hypothetical protein BGV21_09590 [Clostridioides difficile]|uniref:hypothetical protein n=1 Tax=Clostridioides difficile TaxID=1496 RepID=UPI000BB19D78|nr:hypothetical protein [Clostridioides difficile]PBH27302.1 hypothetical protein BGV21_09590 [Clostridioides difficile]